MVSHKPELPAFAAECLRCPVCKSTLLLRRDCYECAQASCGRVYPIVDGIPVLINEQSSVFSVNDFVNRRDTTFNLTGSGSIIRALGKVVRRCRPSISRNYGSDERYARFAGLLKEGSERPRVLVVGGSIEGVGTRQILNDPALDLVEMDVTFGHRTMLICDAHDLPFEDASFDGVIMQAVLEHVVDPQRCVAELYRVLVEGGVAIAETPFMQQVHMGRYDFTRFTHLGHRRLFRQFEEIASAPVGGPGMALAWAYSAFLVSFGGSFLSRAMLRYFAALTGFWLKYLDAYLIRRPGAYDGAAGFSFMGRKRAGYVLSDRELLTLYRGAQAGAILHASG